jgi:hypothetical protein
MNFVPRPLSFVLAAAALAAAADPATNVPATTAAAAPLRVALCPYVPDPGAFETALTNRWAAEGRAEAIEFVSWNCYFEPFPTNADVVVCNGAYLETYAPALPNAGYLDDDVRGDLEELVEDLCDACPPDARPPFLSLRSLGSPGDAGRPDWLDDAQFLPFAADGGKVHGRTFGVPQMVCTYYAFWRNRPADVPIGDASTCELLTKFFEIANPDARFDFLHVVTKTTTGLPSKLPPAEPTDGEGLLFYLSGDDVTLGIVRLVFEQQLASPTDVTNVLAGIVRRGGAEQLAYWPTNGDAFVRADWFREGRGDTYIDYSEALSRIGEMPDGFKPDPGVLFRERTPYFVDYACIARNCRAELLPAARECVRILTSRDYLAEVLWPAGGKPSYLLPARLDLFRDFAARDRRYRQFLADALLPGAHAFRLPPGAPAIIQEAADRTKPLLLPATNAPAADGAKEPAP